MLVRKEYKITFGSKRFWFYGFYDLKFRTCDDDFLSQQEKQLLSGDGWAEFDMILHGEPLCN